MTKKSSWRSFAARGGNPGDPDDAICFGMKERMLTYGGTDSPAVIFVPTRSAH